MAKRATHTASKSTPGKILKKQRLEASGNGANVEPPTSCGNGTLLPKQLAFEARVKAVHTTLFGNLIAFKCLTDRD